MRPSRSLGQNFLVDPNLARAIAADAGAGPGVRMVEVGAGFGSLTVAMAAAGADVLAVEIDRAVAPALREVIEGFPRVRLLVADALRIDWSRTLGSGPWTMAANLPYNIAVPLLLRMLEEAASVTAYVAMVQREVADRLAAPPGAAAYGAVSAKVAYHAEVSTIRRVPREVFWPRPRIESTLLRLTPRRPRIGAGVDRRALFAVIDAAFAERRKTMSNALRRMGLDPAAARSALEQAAVDPSTRAERLGLDEFARLAAILVGKGVVRGE